MTKANNNYSSPRARMFLQKVLENTATGISINLKTEGAALNFRQACYTVRSIDRRANRSYPDNHPLHDKSIFDDIQFTVEERDGEWWVVADTLESVRLDIRAADGSSLEGS